MSAPLQIVYADPGAPGYHCVYYMARLAAELLGGELVILEPREVTSVQKLMAILPRHGGASNCLLICPSPYDLSSLLQVADWRRKYRTLVAWVFDSFWTENIPRFARWTRVFDRIFVTEQEDLDTWRRAVPTSVEWLPWGSDVLRLGSDHPNRPIDLLRFGRQPAQWDDDVATRAACDAQGLVFHGRPPFLEDAMESQRSLMQTLHTAKFALAFSNLASPNPQTHPVREYLTGRWTDALASGAIVAGVPPRSDSVSALLWPEALLDLGTVEKADGIDIIARAVQAWTPERAAWNYRRAREKLDWRLRFEKLAEAFAIRSDQLDKELAELRQGDVSPHGDS